MIAKENEWFYVLSYISFGYGLVLVSVTVTITEELKNDNSRCLKTLSPSLNLKNNK